MEQALTESREDLASRLRDLEDDLVAQHTCRTELRIRTVAGGGKHYVLQCVGCGEQHKGPLPKALALQQLAGKVPEPYDTALQQVAHERKQDQWREFARLNDALTAIDNPIRAQLQQVEQEDANTREQAVRTSIQQCMEAMCTHVSEVEALNLLEKHVALTRERLWADRLKGKKRFSSEQELKAWLVKFLAHDFDLTPEVRGVHLSGGVDVTIDYIARAKPHLIAKGFTPDPFGIEVKHFRVEEDFSSKAAKGFWQTISYTDCEFNLGEAPGRLRFGVLFSNMAFKDEASLVKNFGSTTENDLAVWRAFCQLANHAQVATLEVKGVADAAKGWALKFSGGTYFTARSVPDGWTYRLSNNHLIEKCRVGNF
jgi:hypothetical protein